VVKDQGLAVGYIKRFSELYRRILKTGNRNFISLHEEMLVVNNYLYLQKMAFGDKLIVQIDTSSGTEPQSSLYIPPFSLQMIIENAIKHNTITRSRKLNIHIYIQDELITITNNLQRK